MERAHSVLFGRVDAMLREMTGDDDNACDMLALVSWAYPDGLRFLGEKHRAVEDAAIVLMKKFGVDVARPVMCYHASCDVLRYAWKKGGKDGDGADHCATCSQPIAMECIHCNETHVPLFISEAGCGLKNGQLVCPGCSRDHLVLRETTALCVSCRNVSYIRQSVADEPGKSKCFSCGAARTWYCAECKADTVTERDENDDEPICGGCGETHRDVQARQLAAVAQRERAQEKMAHVGRWIKAMWAGDFSEQVFASWAKGSCDQLNKRKLCQKMIKRVVHRKSSEAFQAWHGVVMLLVQAKVEAIIGIDRILSSSTNERLAHGFGGWKAVWEDYQALDRGQKEAMRLFDVFDTDGDGELTMDELSYRMSDWGHPQEDIDKVMLKVDADMDGIITWDEFLARYHLIRDILGISEDVEEDPFEEMANDKANEEEDPNSAAAMVKRLAAELEAPAFDPEADSQKGFFNGGDAAAAEEAAPVAEEAAPAAEEAAPAAEEAAPAAEEAAPAAEEAAPAPEE